MTEDRRQPMTWNELLPKVPDWPAIAQIPGLIPADDDDYASHADWLTRYDGVVYNLFVCYDEGGNQEHTLFTVKSTGDGRIRPLYDGIEADPALLAELFPDQAMEVLL